MNGVSIAYTCSFKAETGHIHATVAPSLEVMILPGHMIMLV